MVKSYKVMLDTNALLYIERFKVDFFDEIKKELGKTNFYITTHVINELKNIRSQTKQREKEVKIALKLLKKNNVKTLNIKAENADNSLKIAAEKGFIIVSNDKELQKRIKRKQGKVIYLSKKKIVRVN